MARIPRIAEPDVPYHVTQRGNGFQIIFDDALDRYTYLKLLRRYAEKHDLRIWTCCLMTNLPAAIMRASATRV